MIITRDGVLNKNIIVSKENNFNVYSYKIWTISLALKLRNYFSLFIDIEFSFLKIQIKQSNSDKLEDLGGQVMTSLSYLINMEI